ncbi:hypothetical protein SAMN02745165_02500 [Malonomonas rubra DSM 5091]|uniref:Uncharacterized protein n=1 Tax=Malonomonas rubra DSM 5091 TaxID=1122189 RepID=A0A1M6JSD5_MALRU|nr:hypothetical protein [Malonomonas rubra]SHJ49655.1 hypothetical protein SAMN02745165_02500 [Malonomonas rubra DSM 5091]
MKKTDASFQSYCSRFGVIAVDMKYISSEQLKWALDQQVEDNLAGRPHRMLGAICFAHGWMTSEQIDNVLGRMFRSRRDDSGASLEKEAV